MGDSAPNHVTCILSSNIWNFTVQIASIARFKFTAIALIRNLLSERAFVFLFVFRRLSSCSVCKLGIFMKDFIDLILCCAEVVEASVV